MQIDAAAAVAPNDEEKPDNAPEKERDDGLAHALFEVFLRGAAFPIVHERRAGQHDEYGNGKIKKALHKIVGDPAGRFAEIPKGTPVQEHDAEAGIDIQHRDIGFFAVIHSSPSTNISNYIGFGDGCQASGLREKAATFVAAF